MATTAMHPLNGTGAESPQMMVDMQGLYQYGIVIRQTTPANAEGSTVTAGVNVWKRLIPQRYALLVGATWTRAGSTITVTDVAHGLIAGQEVAIWDSSSTAALANGNYTVATVPTADTYTVTGAAAGAASGTCTSGVNEGKWTRSGTTITVQQQAHGFTAGQSIVFWDSTSPAAFPDGTYLVATVPNANTYTITGLNAGATSGWVSPYDVYDLSSNTNATLALGLPVKLIDSHWSLSVAVDSQNRMWIAGNIHNTVQRLAYCAAGNIRSWSIPNYSTHFWSTSGSNQHTYNWFDRMSDGTVIWFFAQNDAAAGGMGRDIIGAYLPVGSGTTWSRLLGGSGTGEIAQASQTAIEGEEAVRAYFGGVVVDENDRIHIWGMWRTILGPAPDDGDSQQQPWYAYSDTLGDATSWKNVSGTTIAMPRNWANRADAAVTSAPGRFRTQGVPFAVDKDGYPHFITGNGATTGEGQLAGMSSAVRVYWTGTAWAVANIVGPGNSQQPSIVRIRDDLYTITSVSGRIRVRNAAGTGVAFLMGGNITSTSPSAYEPCPDPVRLKSGYLDLLIADGDTPRVFTFGNHARVNAA